MEKTVENSNGCLEWIGAAQNDGYGTFVRKRVNRTALAHRWGFAIREGVFPLEGTTLRHLCGNRLCVRHVEIGDPKQQHEDQLCHGTYQILPRSTRKLTCWAGHDLSIHGVVRKGRYGRRCVACREMRRTRLGAHAVVRKQFARIKTRRIGEIVLRDGWACSWCGHYGDLEIQHRVPVTMGGSNEVGNLELLCHGCHNKADAAIQR